MWWTRGTSASDKLLPGARIWIPVKMGAGSDEGGELSQKDLDHNREVAQVRYMVEVAVGRIKQYGVMSGPYRGTPEQYDKDTNILTGLVNLKTLWPHVKAAHADTIRRVTAWRGARLTWGRPRVAPSPGQTHGIGGCGEAAHVMPHVSQIDPPYGPKITASVLT